MSAVSPPGRPWMYDDFRRGRRTNMGTARTNEAASDAATARRERDLARPLVAPPLVGRGGQVPPERPPREEGPGDGRVGGEEEEDRRVGRRRHRRDEEEGREREGDGEVAFALDRRELQDGGEEEDVERRPEERPAAEAEAEPEEGEVGEAREVQPAVREARDPSRPDEPEEDSEGGQVDEEGRRLERVAEGERDRAERRRRVPAARIRSRRNGRRAGSGRVFAAFAIVRPPPGRGRARRREGGRAEETPPSPPRRGRAP